MITIMVFRGPARRGIAAVRAASDGRGQKLLMFIDPSLGVSVIMSGPFILAGVFGVRDPEFPGWAYAVVLSGST